MRPIRHFEQGFGELVGEVHRRDGLIVRVGVGCTPRSGPSVWFQPARPTVDGQVVALARDTRLYADCFDEFQRLIEAAIKRAKSGTVPSTAKERDWSNL